MRQERPEGHKGRRAQSQRAREAAATRVVRGWRVDDAGSEMRRGVDARPSTGEERGRAIEPHEMERSLLMVVPRAEQCENPLRAQALCVVYRTRVCTVVHSSGGVTPLAPTSCASA